MFRVLICYCHSGTPVVRTYIDQLAQVLSALVGWSKIVTCGNSECNGGGGGNQHGNKSECGYLTDVKHENKCDSCGCMKWDVADPNSQGTPLGRKCQRCSDSGGSSAHRCDCSTGDSCSAGKECKCAEAGKCCKCCCKGKCTKCSDKCSCDKGSSHVSDEYHKDSYMSAYPSDAFSKRKTFIESDRIENPPSWKNLDYSPPDKLTNNGGTITDRRHKCARIFLGSVCLIWSGITYMYWTGKYHKSSPRWNNHILDGSGLDDGSLSQWLQALGFPRDMLNNHGPGNRWDAIIWDGFRGMLYLGFPDTGSGSGHGWDTEGNTFRDPSSMNYAGYIHTLEKGAFCSNGNVFPKNANGTTSITDEQMHKCGALFKLYILSCAYFTGLQKRNSESTPRTPRTIREILYWLSALPYSPAYPEILKHGKHRLTEVLKKPGETESGTANEQKQLSFHQVGRNHPITVHEFNLFAHFQAVTQYCPLVLIGIQGGLKDTDSTKEPPIHSLYANTECHFTYPEVPIQAYNQVVHYIRALFYQLYFLRKQCAVKVTCGGKWRECRYGNGVVSKGVISWMCLGCDPMDHDRKCRVNKVKDEILKGVIKGTSGDVAVKVKTLLGALGEVVVQLGNAQEALEGKKGEEINAVKGALEKAKGGLDTAVNGNGGLDVKLGEAKTALEKLTNSGSGNGILKDVETKLDKANSGEYDPGKNGISAAIHKVLEVLRLLKKWAENEGNEMNEGAKEVLSVFAAGLDDNYIEEVLQQGASHEYTILLQAINKLISICCSPKCHNCGKHSTKCGRQGEKRTCDKCHQPYMDGTPSPLQAFLEDRLPGFSCDVVRNTDTDKDTVYPPAASHLYHSNSPGQCCPLPMGFRGQFYSGSTSDMTGQRLYGILYFFSNENMMQSCVYTLVRVTAALSATTPQVLGDVFGFFRGGVGNKEEGMIKSQKKTCDHSKNIGDPKHKNDYFCGWCASGLRDEVKGIQWVPKGSDSDGGNYMVTVSAFSGTDNHVQCHRDYTINAGGTEVIRTLIDHLALGLQKWVGWQEDDKCCLKGDKSNGGESKGIGRKCDCNGTVGAGNCCTSGGGSCQCTTATSGTNTCCYKSAYQRPTTSPSGTTSSDLFLWTSISIDPSKVHLLARIFLGSVCLIWSGLSQLGFLTGGDQRWKDSSLHGIDGATAGVGSFMAAMGYDLDRLNQGKGEYCLGWSYREDSNNAVRLIIM
ncbi:variant erythrocyte surface antigen-1 alpha subunit [Babesia bovis T2Bo]|uniref:Variant erythrocyte surface antigen-1, alpha subunit n=1 Tax=Babesia bovis TaxID=5865 RepID=A7AUX0_BABBO|nr:variant erythrocyte surface antigen-1 alpha subunit [Babesia bovis T2Bo]EDO06731.1 variant erythrocyte surface antigen-1 alpha subunit [Babesia bovis T2Bo]|eukprot:XP_001610299.1 variant erythrocyte surface antigen-1, alpha subunit [Babesia bovis T2Bo]